MIKAYSVVGKGYDKDSEVMAELPNDFYIKKKNGVILIGMTAKEALFLASDLTDAAMTAIKALKEKNKEKDNGKK
jgi:hypothetical protein